MIEKAGTDENSDSAEGPLQKKADSRVLLADNERLKKALIDVLDTLPSIIARIDREGRVDLVNRQLELFSGVSAAEAFGVLLESLIPHFTPQLRQVAEAIDRQNPISFAKIQYCSGTDVLYFSMHVYPLRNENSGMAVIRIDDITEHVRIEESMIQSEKMMMVGGLAAGMAHEINNPLGAIMQHAQNIERRVSLTIPANSKAAEEVGVSLDQVRAYLEKRNIFEFLEHIRTAGSRAAEIVTNMLKFSRRGHSRIETVVLASVLDQVLALAATDYDMKKLYDFRHIELVREYSADTLRVAMNVSEMEHALLNILKNAAQAISEAAVANPRITVRTLSVDGMAAIEVEDNGPGMDETIRLRIFDPFFSTKEIGVGIGLGLSVTYAIVTREHHGTIEAWSQPGVGSRFTIKIPLHRRNG
ncbi:MAG: ATP-binding protein [Desulfuromonadaceae bacterium]|nr:ATP-binding protein [Desulfuromonadaceae bacterium]MDD5105094.1 ATP-binding protein [Desulfuromonadaceae bacterium]